MAAPRKTPSNLITGAEYARRIGVGAARVTALFKRGMPFTAGRDERGVPCKHVDPEVCDQWRAQNLTPKIDGEGRMRGIVAGASGEAAPKTKPDALTESAVAIQASRARIQSITERREQLKLDRDEGKLADREAAIEVVEGFADACAAVIDRMPMDAATVLAGAVGCTEHAAYVALQAVAVRMREDLARTADAKAAEARALGRGDAVDEDREAHQAA